MADLPNLSDSKLVIIGASQINYWEREFGSISTQNPSDLECTILYYNSIGIRPVVQLGLDFELLSLISKLPKNSIIVNLFADETYNLKLNL